MADRGKNNLNLNNYRYEIELEWSFFKNLSNPFNSFERYWIYILFRALWSLKKPVVSGTVLHRTTGQS